MHDAGASAWREIVEKSHARLMEELTAAIELDRRKAVDSAVAAEQGIAAAKVEQVKAKLEEVKAEREQVKAELEKQRAEREKARAELAASRESAATEIVKSRENAEKQLAAEMEKAGKLLAAERERASAELNSARDRANAGLDKVRTELAASAAKSVTAARQAATQTLNQSLRRIREANSVDAVLQLVAELSSAYDHKAVVLVFENNQARVAASRLALAGSAAANGAGSDRVPEVFDLTLENAPALASAIETRDPVTVLARESEISPALARLLGAAPSEKVYLFPIVARHQIVAMLVVAGEVFPPAPELLAEAAGMKLEAITETVKKSPRVDAAAENLVNIQRAAVPASETADRRSWEDLSAEDQKLHLQAQRVARVRVARMRLDREEAWRRGLAQSDVYGALRRDIESARTEFLQSFLSKSSTMVDYLHLEILRSLANEDDRLLGREYPGPMV